MENINKTLLNMRLLDDLSKQDSPIHRIHPLIKLLTTLVFLFMVVSFQKAEIARMLPFFIYPIMIFSFTEISVWSILKRVLLVAPFIFGIGILNPIFEQETVLIFEKEISLGWLTFISICIKGLLTVTVSILLIATTGMEKLAAALRMLKVPKIFVLQILLTYRYISVLIEDVATMMRAYSLRAPGQKGIHWKAWGSFTGQLLLRTFDRAQRIYQAMILRGFTGEYDGEKSIKFKIKDLLYFVFWSLFFIIARLYNIPMLLGSLVSGMVN